VKICFTVNSSPWSEFKGGGQIAVHQLATALAEMGQEVHVLYSATPEGALALEVPYKIHWVRHYNCATLNLNIFSFARGLELLTEKHKFDVIHGNAEEAFFSDRISQKIGAKFFYTSHAPSLPRTDILQGLLTQPILFLKSINPHLQRSTASRADKIIAFSQFSKEQIVTALGPEYREKIEVATPGVDPAWHETRRINPQPKDFIFWGRMEKEKGLPELITAFREVVTAHPSARLHLVGEGHYEKECKALVKTQKLDDSVYFHGWMELCQIKQVVSQCRFAVFPSRIESFGLAMAEAQSVGMPIIAARAGALPEFIEDNVNGILVPPNNAPALAQAMIHALDNPERMETLGEKAKTLAQERFNWKKTAERMLELYQSTP
jgi:glycosyltransferase involved in cell wall biosynthesis